MMVLKLTWAAIVVLAAAACAGGNPPETEPVDPAGLATLMEDRAFHQTLGTDEFVVLRQFPYRVVIETRDGRQRIWDLVYVVDHGWRLRGEAELLELIPGRGFAPVAGPAAPAP